jgi:hypothetical protein
MFFIICSIFKTLNVLENGLHPVLKMDSVSEILNIAHNGQCQT